MAHQRADYERPPYKVASPHPSLRDTFPPRGKALKRSIVDDVISTEAGVLTRTQRRNPPRSASRRRQVGWRGYASGISFPRDCHVARCSPRNDKAVCVFACFILSFRLFYTVISTEVRALTRTQRRNPPAVKVFRPCTTLPVSHRVTYDNVYDSSRSSSGNRLQRVRFYGVNLHISAKKRNRRVSGGFFFYS